MKKYNYENISESTHVTHLWEPLKFTLKDNYRYISKSKLFSFFSNLIAAIIFPILIILNKILFGFKIENKDKVLKNTGFVSVSNHVHYMDCTMIALLYFPKRVYFPTLQSNFKIPFIRHLIKILYAIPIPTKDNQKVSFYNDINKALLNKKIVQMYPEASMWPYYEKVRSFKYGAFKMAVTANVPIQPLKFVFQEPTGIYKLYKRKKCLHLIVLDPIYPDLSLQPKERIADLRDKAYNAINKGE